MTAPPNQGSKADLSFQCGVWGFFILVLNQKSVFFVLLKLYASAKNVQHLTLLVQSFIEAAILAYISDTSFKF